MKILAKKLTLDEFREYVINKNFGSLPPTFIVLHHTWNPVKDDGDGIPEKGEWNVQDPVKTLTGIKNYYESKGWIAGPHLFIYEDEIWLFTDMYEVGIHAGEGNGTAKTGYSIGIEVVGNYDLGPWDDVTRHTTIGVIKTLMDRLDMKEKDIKFHSDYSSKTCPGKYIKKDWVIERVRNFSDKPASEHTVTEIKRVAKDILGIDVGDKINPSEDKKIADAIVRLGTMRDRIKDIVNKS